MRKLLIALMLATSASAALWAVAVQAQVPGCCMERDDYDEAWQECGLDYGECIEYNDAVDGDYILEESGFVWWNGNCD